MTDSSVFCLLIYFLFLTGSYKNCLPLIDSSVYCLPLNSVYYLHLTGISVFWLPLTDRSVYYLPMSDSSEYSLPLTDNSVYFLPMTDSNVYYLLIYLWLTVVYTVYVALVSTEFPISCECVPGATWVKYYRLTSTIQTQGYPCLLL